MNTHWAFGLLFGITGTIVAAYGLRAAMIGRILDERIAREKAALFLGRWLMEAFYWNFQCLGRFFIRFHISPDLLTWLSLTITAVSLPLTALGNFSSAGIFFLGGSVFDALDGLVARQQNLASDAGELFDAVIDRYADAAVLLGLTFFYRSSFWLMAIPLAALLGSFMVSYVRAKTEALGLRLSNHGMRRHQRVAYLGIALIVGPEISRWIPEITNIPHPVTWGGIAFVAVASHYAAICLALEGRLELIRLGRGPRGFRQ